MEQIQGSVRDKINEYVHALSEFLFVSQFPCGLLTEKMLKRKKISFFHFFLSFSIFNFCLFQFLSPNFYYFTSLHGLQYVENHCVHLRDIELQTGTKISYFRLPHVFFSI